MIVETHKKANVAVELRDSIENYCSGANYPIFLAKIWPVFKKILTGDPVFTNLSYEQVRTNEALRGFDFIFQPSYETGKKRLTQFD